MILISHIVAQAGRIPSGGWREARGRAEEPILTRQRVAHGVLFLATASVLGWTLYALHKALQFPALVGCH